LWNALYKFSTYLLFLLTYLVISKLKYQADGAAR